MREKAGGRPAPTPLGWPLKASYAAYAAGGAAFAAGLVLLVAGRAGLGVLLALAGILAVSAGWVVPLLPWEAWRQARAAAGSRTAAGRSRAAGLPAPAPAAAGPVAKALAWALAWFAAPPEDGDGDLWVFNRFWLLAPVLLLFTASAILSLASTVQGVAALGLAVLVLWVYFQDMTRPLVLPHVRQNVLALCVQAPALPFQALGVWILDTHYDKPALVWAGFFLCAASSLWAYFALRRWPLDLSEDASPEPLDRPLPAPFYTPLRLSIITGLAALAAVSACLAVFVFPGDDAGLSVAAGFLAMGLLVGSFPWLPSGLAFWPRLASKPAAFLGLACALLAFALGAHGQDLLEANAVNAGLWFYLAGGVILVLGLSRFSAAERENGAGTRPWPRLEMAALAALVVLGFAFRIWKIGSFPFGTEGDEAGGGIWALNVLQNNVENHLVHENYPLAFFSVTALFYKVWGVGIATMRLHAVVFGTLSIASVYFFLRLNMGRAAAFLATLLMSFSYWHLHYSRFGHYNIEQVAVQMVAFYFVFKALRTRLLWQWAAAGVAFALAMFPHMSGRILPFEGLALLAYLFVARRDLLRRHATGFLVFLALAWAVSAPVIVYWARVQSISMGRISDVSIFNKKNSNAPLDTLQGFVSNCRSSMLMFNVLADTRPRDNPVAPDKILEHWTGILFALAFLYSLYHWRRPLQFFLLGAFLLNLCASIFSVEAPQTLRTAGNIPLVFAFIAVPLGDLLAALRAAGRGVFRAAFVLLLAVFSFFCWRSARRLFVDERYLSFDAEPTYIALTAGQEGGADTQGVFWGTGFASGHPPVQLLRKDTPVRNFYGPFEYLPISINTDRDNLLFLGDDYERMFPYIQWLYPGVTARSLDAPWGASMAFYVRVGKGAILKDEGLDGWVRAGGVTRPVSGAPPAWPWPGAQGAREVDLSGSLDVDAYGTYGLYVDGAGDARVDVDGRTVFSRRSGAAHEPPVLLAKGLHDLRLVMKPASGTDAMRLRLDGLAPGPGGVYWSLNTLTRVPVDLPHVFRAPANGILARYFESLEPKGKPMFEVVEPVVLDHWLDSPFVGNWSVLWSTRFRVETPGNYSFSVQAGGESWARVDSKLVWRQEPPSYAPAREKVLPFVRLSKGWHDYEAEFGTQGPPSCELDWVTPDGKSGVFWVPGMKPFP